MTGAPFTLCDVALVARASGALWWPDKGLLCVSDLHLGKSERIARRGGAMLPPYDTRETLARLDAEIEALAPRAVICLGDSFDDLGAADALEDDASLWIARLQAGRTWTWIEGNHDPGPVRFGGAHRDEVSIGPLILRHIARAGSVGEISGHYHPKARIAARGRSMSRPCFLVDTRRVILPAFGAYTGGLRSSDPVLANLMEPMARAILTGRSAITVPMPR